MQLIHHPGAHLLQSVSMPQQLSQVPIGCVGHPDPRETIFHNDADNRQKLQQALGVSGTPGQPYYFEALVRTQAVAGAPNATSIVATRLIHP